VTDIDAWPARDEPRSTTVTDSAVLIVDDRADSRRALRATLEPLHVPVVEASSGEEALRELLRRSFALVLLDVQMPGIDGFQTAELIKRHPRTADIPIILLTAFDEPLARADEGYSFGAVDYIAKPCDPVILRAKVRVFLDLHQARVLLERQRTQLENHVDQLRLSRSALADAQRIANLGSWEYDPAAGRIRGSAQLHAIFGEPVEEPLPAAGELFGRLRLDGTEQTGEVLLRTASRATLEATLARPDGAVRDVVIHLEPRSDTLQLIGTIQDVTEQRVARRALDAARRALEHEREVVKLFQEAVAEPIAPHGPEIQLSYCYRPADSSVIGGDWYDVLRLADGSFLLVIGDVAGHGLPAASAMAEIRTALRMVSLSESRPSRLVHELDRFLKMSRPGVFATMVIVRFDPDNGTCTMTNAGHVSPLEFGREQELLHAGATSPPLGAASGGAPEEVSFVLPWGHALVLYTDGLVERRGEPIDEGLARLCKMVSTLAVDTPHLAHEIVRACTDGDLRDDIAVLALHHRGPTPEFATSFPADVRELGALRTDVRRWMLACGGDRRSVDDIVLAISEIAANACIHAYRPGTDGSVRLEAFVDGDDIVGSIHDDGAWRRPRDDDGGHGLKMAGAVAAEMVVVPGPQGTTVTLRCRFKSGMPRP
jgi:serine phosphatase RsbU (regulator of sigma subunit)/CheY-like chemotaxis protein/anti-sigma regulatory factor (Ser/Thr protein kinase)